jgi:hypothetical protein
MNVIRKAGAGKYTIQNKWAFRHEIIVNENTG